MNNRHRKTSLTKYFYLSLYCKGSKRVIQGLRVRRELETEHNWNIFTPKLIVVSVVSFSFSRCSTGGPEATLLGDGFLYGILSASSPDLNSSRSKGPFGLIGLSLPHLVYNSVQSSTQLAATQLARRTQLSYIIVRRPLDLWYRMFNCHQAEITVMQFRSHSLPVHQSMSVPWEFLSSSHFINQFPPTRFPLITAIRMCHLLPVHHLGMTFLAGSKGQNITISQILSSI